ncbi:MAG: tail fiber domain-containing protein [Candidatus Campbellbacteria bacterium]|nr:tail fiber domain-containing protein [Candidatus Campbellbacteria bacterium]
MKNVFLTLILVVPIFVFAGDSSYDTVLNVGAQKYTHSLGTFAIASDTSISQKITISTEVPQTFTTAPTFFQRIQAKIRSWFGATGVSEKPPVISVQKNEPTQQIVPVAKSFFTPISTQGSVLSEAVIQEVPPPHFTIQAPSAVDKKVQQTEVFYVVANAVAALRAELLPKIKSASRSPITNFPDNFLELSGGTLTGGLTGTTLTLSDTLSVAGTFADSSGDVGTSGYVLQSTETGTDWVATSTLGIGGISEWLDTGTYIYPDGSKYVQTLFINATSTTATSTFSGGLSVAGSSGLTVLQNGNVGISTTSPSQKLVVGGSVLVSGSISAAGTAIDSKKYVYVNATGLDTTSGGIYGGFFSLAGNGNSENSLIGIRGSATRSSGAFSHGAVLGVQGAGIVDSGQTTDNVTGTEGTAQISGTTLQAYGAYNQVSSVGSGASITSAFGTYSDVVTAASGVIGSAYGYYGKVRVLGGSITDAYGLYLESITSGSTNNYSIYSAGGKSYFAGNVGVGTTSPWRTLSVTGTVGFAGLTTNTGAATASLCLDANNEVTRNTDNETCITSSLRYKHDINELSLEESQQVLSALRPVSFEYNQIPGLRYGLIAEEVEKVDSRLIGYDDQGRPNSVRYTSIIPLLIKTVQDLSIKVELTLANAATGVSNFFDIVAQKLTTDELTTNKLCVGTTCVNESQLQEILDSVNVSSTPPPVVETPPATEVEPSLEAPTSTSEISPVVEPPAIDLPAQAGEPIIEGQAPEPILEPVVEPTPNPAPESTP